MMLNPACDSEMKEQVRQAYRFASFLSRSAYLFTSVAREAKGETEPGEAAVSTGADELDATSAMAEIEMGATASDTS